jgi:hypothetical protein
MSLSEPASGGLKECKCERTVLCKSPPVPYIPKEDPVQETVSALKKTHLKTHMGEHTTFQLSIWNFGTHNALLMHVGSTLDPIKKHGNFMYHKEAQEI